MEKSTVASTDVEMEKLSHCENESNVQETIDNAKVQPLQSTEPEEVVQPAKKQESIDNAKLQAIKSTEPEEVIHPSKKDIAIGNAKEDEGESKVFLSCVEEEQKSPPKKSPPQEDHTKEEHNITPKTRNKLRDVPPNEEQKKTPNDSLSLKDPPRNNTRSLVRKALPLRNL